MRDLKDCKTGFIYSWGVGERGYISIHVCTCVFVMFLSIGRLMQFSIVFCTCRNVSENKKVLIILKMPIVKKLKIQKDFIIFKV